MRCKIGLSPPTHKRFQPLISPILCRGGGWRGGTSPPTSMRTHTHTQAHKYTHTQTHTRTFLTHYMHTNTHSNTHTKTRVGICGPLLPSSFGIFSPLCLKLDKIKRILLRINIRTIATEWILKKCLHHLCRRVENWAFFNAFDAYVQEWVIELCLVARNNKTIEIDG